MTYTFKKKITGKWYDNRIELLEWNDGKQIFQKVLKIAKNKRQGITVLYSICPIEKGGTYDMNSLYIACKSDSKLLWDKK